MGPKNLSINISPELATKSGLQITIQISPPSNIKSNQISLELGETPAPTPEDDFKTSQVRKHGQQDLERKRREQQYERARKRLEEAGELIPGRSAYEWEARIRKEVFREDQVAFERSLESLNEQFKANFRPNKRDLERKRTDQWESARKRLIEAGEFVPGRNVYEWEAKIRKEMCREDQEAFDQGIESLNEQFEAGFRPHRTWERNDEQELEEQCEADCQEREDEGAQRKEEAVPGSVSKPEQPETMKEDAAPHSVPEQHQPQTAKPNSPLKPWSLHERLWSRYICTRFGFTLGFAIAFFCGVCCARSVMVRCVFALFSAFFFSIPTSTTILGPELGGKAKTAKKSKSKSKSHLEKPRSLHGHLWARYVCTRVGFTLGWTIAFVCGFMCWHSPLFLCVFALCCVFVYALPTSRGPSRHLKNSVDGK